jgi:hypothetical protein
MWASQSKTEKLFFRRVAPMCSILSIDQGVMLTRASFEVAPTTVARSTTTVAARLAEASRAHAINAGKIDAATRGRVAATAD